jgi:hypothetical protein
VGCFTALVDEGIIKLSPGSALALTYNKLYITVLLMSSVWHEAPNSTDGGRSSTQSDVPILGTQFAALKLEGY